MPRRVPVRWAVLALLFAYALSSYVLRTNISVAAVFMMPELQLTEVQMGMVFSSFLWSYSLFQLPAAALGDTHGPRLILTWSAVAWAALTWWTGLLPGAFAVGGTGVLVALIVLRFALGIVQAPTFPVAAALIARWFPPSAWALPNGLLSAGLGVGTAVTPPLIAWVMVQAGWRETFYCSAPIGLVVAWATWRYVRDDPARHPGVSHTELAELRDAVRGAGGDVHDHPVRWQRLLRDPQVLLLSLSYLSMNYIFYVFVFWFFLYLVNERHFSILGGGAAATVPYVVGALCAAIGGALCDRLSVRWGSRAGCRVLGVGGLVLAGALSFVGASAGDAATALVALSLCFGFTQLTEGAYWAAMTRIAGRSTGAACGIMNTGGNLGGVISAPLIPVLVQWFGWEVALSSGALFAGLGALLWLAVRPDEPLADTQRSLGGAVTAQADALAS